MEHFYTGKTNYRSTGPALPLQWLFYATFSCCNRFPEFRYTGNARQNMSNLFKPSWTTVLSMQFNPYSQTKPTLQEEAKLSGRRGWNCSLSLLELVIQQITVKAVKAVRWIITSAGRNTTNKWPVGFWSLEQRPILDTRNRFSTQNRYERWLDESYEHEELMRRQQNFYDENARERWVRRRDRY